MIRTNPLLIAAVLVAVACSKSAQAPRATEHAADYVFTNAKVYTVNPDQKWAEAIAIRGNEIVYVGDADGTKALESKDTQVLDLDGKMVLPGFVSGHDHLIASNWTKAGVDLFSAQSKDDYLRMIREYAQAHPDDEIVFGYGWDRTTYGGFPTAKELDSAVSDRPAMIFDFTIHDLWFNTKGLAAGKVTKDTPDPKPGFSYWRRDKKGIPEGVGVEVCWLDAYMTAGAWKPGKLMTASQKLLYQKAVEAGYTAVINQGLVTPNITNLTAILKDYEYSFSMLEELDKQGKLQLRTYQQVVYKNSSDSVEQLIQGTLELRERYNSDRLRVSGIKIHPEGNWNSHTSLMLEPYANKPGDRGQAGISAERVLEIIVKANEAGIDVSTHVDGSATVRATIDAIEASKRAGHEGARNSLQHYHVVHPHDHERVVAMGIPINVTPVWATDWSKTDQQALTILGRERVKTHYMPFQDAFQRGVRVSMSADVPSSPVDDMAPLFSIEAALTSRDPSNPDSKSFLAGRPSVTLDQAIQGVTIFPAWQARMEDKLGTLEVGKYADLVILEKNLFAVEPTDIADVKVMATMMDGQFTYRDGL